jgi:hypothetical protein
LRLVAFLVSLSQIPLLLILRSDSSAAPIPLGALLASRVATGLVHGLVFPAVHAELGAIKRTHSLSIATVVATANGMYLGAAFAMVTTPLLIAHAFPAAVATLSAALHLAWLAAALCCCARAGTEPGAGIEPGGGGGGGWAADAIPLLRVMRHPAAIAILGCTCAFAASVVSLMSWLPTFASHAQLPAAVRAAPYLCMYATVLLAGRCADALQERFGVRRARVLVTVSGNASAVAALLCLPLQGRPTTSFALLSFALGAATFSRAGYAINHLDIAPGPIAGTVLGVIKLVGIVVGALSSYAVGKQIDGSADDPTVWRLIFRAMAAGFALATLIYAQCARGEELFPSTTKAGAPRDAEGGEYTQLLMSALSPVADRSTSPSPAGDDSDTDT